MQTFRIAVWGMFFLLSGFDVGANALAEKTFLGIDAIPTDVADNSF